MSTSLNRLGRFVGDARGRVAADLIVPIPVDLDPYARKVDLPIVPDVSGFELSSHAAAQIATRAAVASWGGVVPPTLTLAQAAQISAAGNAGGRIWISDFSDGANAVYSDGVAWVRENTKGVLAIALASDTAVDLLTHAPTLLITSGLSGAGTKSLVLPANPRPGSYRRFVRTNGAGTLGTLSIAIGMVGAITSTLVGALGVGAGTEFIADAAGTWQKIS